MESVKKATGMEKGDDSKTSQGLLLHYTLNGLSKAKQYQRLTSHILLYQRPKYQSSLRKAHSLLRLSVLHLKLRNLILCIVSRAQIHTHRRI